jgi:hypothetical protein
MPNFYPYLISSLPMLHFSGKAPFSWETFLEKCAGLIPQKDLRTIADLPKTEEGVEKSAAQPAIKKWIAFDAALRNELVKARSGRKHIEAWRYLRPDGYSGTAIAQAALAAQRNPSILEAERFLDLKRWDALEELAFGHYFDLEFLIVYTYKLLILLRWEKVYSADKAALLEDVLQA